MPQKRNFELFCLRNFRKFWILWELSLRPTILKVKRLFLSEIHFVSFQWRVNYGWFLIMDDPNLRFEIWMNSNLEFSCYDMNCETNLFQNYYFWRVRKKKFKNKNSKCSNQIFPKPSKYFDFINYFKLNNFFFISKYKFIFIHFNLKCPWRWISQTSVKIYFWTNQIRVFLGQTVRCKQFAWS